MANFPVISMPLRRSLLAVEITILVVSFWLNINNVEFQSSPTMIWQLALLNGAIAPFTFWLPVHRSMWQRRVYLFSALAILFMASQLRMPFYTLILLFLLKACFLVPRREVILVAISYVFFDTFSLWWRLPSEFDLIRARGVEIYLNPMRIISNNIITYLGSCTFVLLLGNVWAEEQKVKRRAEVLTLQVESLAADLERNRIARDIHDSLGHSLTTLDIQIELAQRLQATDPERSQKSLDIAKTLTSQCLDDVRRTLRTMQRSHFDLKEAIVALSDQITQNQSLQIEIDLQFPQFSLQTSYQLYCIVQESLTNIQKHAQASQVTLKGVLAAEGTTLAISDNGKGFDVNQLHSGFGLRGMKERVQCLGGKFYLDSEIDRGTHIEIFVPS